MKNSYKLFSEPKVIFQEVFSALEKAKKSIYMEAYELRDEHIGREIIRILAKKSLDIPVTLIVDDYGFEIKSKSTLKLIEKSNIEFLIFNPLYLALKEKNISKLSRFFLRNHRKLTIIDETIAYTGGTNYTAQELPWRDIFVRIKGPLVKQLVQASYEMKQLAKNKHMLKQPINKKLTKQFRKNAVVIRQIPHSFHRPTYREIKRIFSQAKKEIRITTPYFVPTIPFLYLIYKAAHRGINVKIMIPKKSDNYWVDIMSDFFANLVFRNKAQVFLQHQMSHAKYIIVDDNICTFGSNNFDYLSFHNMHELNIFTRNKQIISRLKKLFDKDVKASILFNERTKRNNNWWRKFVAKVLQPFKKFF